MRPEIALAAGVVATALFVLSTLPMLYKAVRTKNLSSYSGSNLVIANTGNAAQMLYVVTLPLGPVLALHAFNTAASALMLMWWVRYREPHPHADVTAELPIPQRNRRAASPQSQSDGQAERAGAGSTGGVGHSVRREHHGR